MSINFVTDKVNLKVDGRVATVEMNRPEALNAMDTDVIRGLACKLKEISESDDVDIVVLTGKGRAFSAGGDIKTMLSNMNESDFLPVMDCISELIITLYSIPKLTISAISGAAAGLGFSLALATDYIIADKASKLAMNFIGIGLIPDGGAHFFLEKRLGETRAKQVIWDGKMMGSEEALKLGLIQEIASDGLQETLDARLSDWLSRPVQAMIKTKKILAEKNRPQLLKILELEKYGQQKMRETMDHQEGIQAFMEKRKPNFIGK
ncbi:Enoyl-CoA-hydratase [Neobacillus rhizosphaerae]|uniref:Enoyl-CoA-hydratase n=1 Tax=Neobacillus rhizosphaerae TaxID=2880965 RepID=A0ABM9ELX1_9BACI|nr:enoyl-CoA hydratase [Neobacillus rhizosphaerae]CAH2713570.1 Enoyl-CoA-hydratase [Neobacillus rhizosphaerae]